MLSNNAEHGFRVLAARIHGVQCQASLPLSLSLSLSGPPQQCGYAVTYDPPEPYTIWQ